MTKEQEARRYIYAIRNPDKQQYAGLWWQFINGRTYKPEVPKSLSYMAAQAVRMRLLDIQERQGC